jgi:TMEM175 potassium channel family protein
MRTYYNRISGQSLERLAALSDGIFAVAMTLLVLDLRTPVADAGARFTTPLLWTSQGLGKELALLGALGDLVPHSLPYVMSFLTLGIFWVGQQTQLNHFTTSNRHLTWIHLAFLLAVSLMPFSTGLLSEFITYRIALVVYWLNLLLLGVALLGSWRYAQRAGLMKDDVTAEICSATERRIVFYQAFYAFAVLLCVINTYVSVVLLVLMQFNSAIAPRFGRLDRF